MKEDYEVLSSDTAFPHLFQKLLTTTTGKSGFGIINIASRGKGFFKTWLLLRVQIVFTVLIITLGK